MDTVTEGVFDYMMTLSPVQWKSQDHYRLLGLDDKRYKATQEEIKQAYHSIARKLHPDKLQSSGVKDLEKATRNFICVLKAFETLSDPATRLAFDSVDPGVIEHVPPGGELKALFEESFDAWAQTVQTIIDRELRFYEGPRNKVPRLGNMSARRDHIMRLYNFLRTFDSTRTFGYHNEEDSGANPFARREQMKQFKAEEARLRRLERERLLQVVETIEKSDGRLQ